MRHFTRHFTRSEMLSLNGIEAGVQWTKSPYRGKDPRGKKSRKQKLRELDQKGESKEGTDMDAFTTTTTETAATATATPSTNDSSASPAPVDKEEEEEPAAVDADMESISEKTVEHTPTEKADKSDTITAQITADIDEKVTKPEEVPVTKPEEAPVTKPEEAPVTKPEEAPVTKPEEAPVTKPEEALVITKETTPEPVRTEPSPKPEEPTVESKPVDKVEMSAEDSKVAEKNEKNEESGKPVSEETNETSSAKIDESTPVIKRDKIELKYKYREDQWSPLNPEGKKSYDRNFMLGLQFATESTIKPAGLPILPDVILDKPLTKNDTPSGVTRGGGYNMAGSLRPGSVADFTPGFFRPSPGGAKGGPNMGSRSRSQQKRGGGGQGGGNEPRKIISISIGQDIKLHHTDNAWKLTTSTTVKPVAEDPEKAKTEDLYKRVKGILNKLTPQKFQTLITQVLDLGIDSEERIRGVIDLVFEKAIDEPNFSVAYANMCKCMMHLKVPAESNPAVSVTFRKLLLTRCQKEFEKDKANDLEFEKRQQEIDSAEKEDVKKKLIAEKDLVWAQVKRRSLGNIRFIGELFKLQMLTESIMHDCIVRLLKSNDGDSLECLCRLMTTIGKDVDHEKAKPRMDQYFQRMGNIVGQKRTLARVRFMLQDVMELRRNNWVPRREDNNPKTIDQIHREVQIEDQQKAQMLQNFQAPTKQRGSGSGGGGGGGRGGRPAGAPVDDGWQAVGKTNRNMQTIDASKMKITKQNVDENIQLGPGGRPGFSMWGRGSSGGSKTAASSAASTSQENDRPSNPANRFSALSGGSEGYNQRGRGMTPSRDAKGARTPYGRGKTTARLSQEQDRESALSAVRNMVGTPGGRLTPTGSRNQSRDNSQNREASREQREPARTAPPPAKELSEEELAKKAKSIIDEYLHINDRKEAIVCVKELESPRNIHMFVYNSVNHVLERSSQARRQTGLLLHDLVKQNLVSVEAYLRGTKEILEFAEDMEIDIPKIWNYLGELIGPMVQDGSVPLSFLKSACQPLQGGNKAGRLVAEVLHDASSRLGHFKVGEQWRESGLQWSDFLGDSENVGDFLKEHNLGYTVGPEEPRSPDAKSLPIDRIESELVKLIIDQNATNEAVFDWIEANVAESRSREPQFIRALMTVVCNSAIAGTGQLRVEATHIQKRSILLQKYLDHKADLELQALYALQALVHQLQHPSGLLRTFFDTLYDEDIISEDAFNQWDLSSDPGEQAGKGVAKSSVVQFFTWLREADEDQDEQ